MKTPSTDSRYFLKYDLDKDPFPLESIDRNYYLTPELNHRLAWIRNLVVTDTKLLVLTASPGGGKTVFSQHLHSLAEPNWTMCLARASTVTTIDLLAHDIVRQALPGKAEDSAPPVSQIHKYLEYSAQKKTVPVVIIDDAHKLPVETLEFVLQLAELRYAESLFRIVLVADESINDRLADPKFKDLTAGVIQNLHLPSFSKKQTKSYIAHRLSLCGQTNEYPFTDDTIGYIYKITGGLPKGINLLARQIMQDKAGTSAADSGSRYGRLVVGAGLLSLGFLALYFLYFNKQQYEEIPGAVMTLPEPSQQTTTQESASPEEQSVPDEPAITQVEEVESAEKNEPLDGDIVAIDNPLPEDLPDADAGQQIAEDEPVSEVTSMQAETELPSSEVPSTEPPVEPEEEYSVITPEAPIPGGSDENIYNLDQIPDFISGIKGPAWLRQQPAGAFVLQLISAQDISNIEKLLSGQSGVQEHLSGYVKYTPSGKPRYLLLYGIYPDQETAEAAVNGLPAGLKSVHPWPRDIASVVEELDKLASGN